MRSAGVGEQSMFARGVAEEPGRSRRLHEWESKAEDRGTGVQYRRGAGQQQLPPASRRAEVRGTARRTKASEAGRTMGSRSALIVPRKPEKRTARDPVEGSEAPGHGTVEGKHERDIGPAVCVNETSTDSRTGEANAGSGTDHVVPQHRSRTSARSVSKNPKGRSYRR